MEVEAEKKRSAPTGALEVLLPFYFMKVNREVTLQMIDERKAEREKGGSVRISQRRKVSHGYVEGQANFESCPTIARKQLLP